MASISRMALPWRMVGALVLGALLAKWGWVLFAPRPTVIAAAQEQVAAQETSRLFGVAAPVAVPVQAAPLPNVRLIGVFAPERGNHGFAVLKVDETQQLGVALGENVAAGVKLLEIHPDHVLLERAGMKHRVDLEGNNKGAASAGAVQGLK